MSAFSRHAHVVLYVCTAAGLVTDYMFGWEWLGRLSGLVLWVLIFAYTVAMLSEEARQRCRTTPQENIPVAAVWITAVATGWVVAGACLCFVHVATIGLISKDAREGRG